VSSSRVAPEATLVDLRARRRPRWHRSRGGGRRKGRRDRPL